MKFVDQLDYPHIPYITRLDLDGEDREKGKSTTIKSSGCGLCSAIMVLDRLVPNAEFSLEEAVELSYSVGANRRFGTSYKKFAPAFAEKFGLKYECTPDPERMLFCLRTGGVAVVNVAGDKDGRSGIFSHVGHYVTVIAEETDSRLAILDPAYQEGRYDTEERKGKVEVTHGVIALCSLETLVEDATTTFPAYHLFWRA
jgi:hypothetical protein